ncbi:TetR/AcrR family transcriptional regulator [Hymenobacter lucidus]|uniref:TetR/AcrR family transcriptional regulator n=1 Tax=Hymenobacter lucidus TaxID=2880930 RepID=A0ABS8AVX0_9BACT|nr:TetR/AcrR family transcriptional regulator [Hymenobacter lucidus]MCB2409161.1 TetR/AcrR family transcriptional regulator [Hymenobacter lucidus]
MARPAKYDRETMLQRALDLFWTKGYEATSVQNLLTGLDIHRGTLYDSFGDKHTLYLEVLAYYEDKVGKPLLALLWQPGSKKVAIEQLFATLVRNFGQDTGRRGCLVTNAAMELALSDAEVAARVGFNQQRFADGFLQALQQAVADGDLAPRTPEQLQTLALFLLTTLQGLRVLARTHTHFAELQQVANLALAALD